MYNTYKKNLSLQEFSRLVNRIEYGAGKIIHLYSSGIVKLKSGGYKFLGELLMHEGLSEALSRIEELYGEHFFTIEPYVIKSGELAEVIKFKKLSEEMRKRSDVRAIPPAKKKLLLEQLNINPSYFPTEGIDAIISIVIALLPERYKRRLEKWYSLKLSRRRKHIFSGKYNLAVRVKQDDVLDIGALFKKRFSII